MNTFWVFFSCRSKGFAGVAGMRRVMGKNVCFPTGLRMNALPPIERIWKHIVRLHVEIAKQKTLNSQSNTSGDFKAQGFLEPFGCAQLACHLYVQDCSSLPARKYPEFLFPISFCVVSRVWDWICPNRTRSNWGLPTFYKNVSSVYPATEIMSPLLI